MKTFEELRSRAIKGPYSIESGRDCFYITGSESFPNYVSKTVCDTEQDKCDAEAITRLLNAFVAGDGFKVLLDAEKAISFAMSSVPVSTAAYVNLMNNRAALRALIAQLDGN